ncbi:MAG: glycosyltransferase family 4 protein [Bryobacteraceae bacterium]
MKFSVDAHAIGRHLTGNEVYVRSLLSGFAALDKEAEFVTYLSSEDAQSWVPNRFARRSVSPNPFVRLGRDLSRRLREDRPDLLHVQYTAPIGCPVPVVVSVHDVSFIEHPEFFPWPRAWQLRMTVRRTVRSAARILTGSEFSRQSIERAYGLNGDRVVVVPNAAASDFRPEHLDNALDAVRVRFGLPAPYILTVGDLQPRKNHIGLIEAFAGLVKAHPQLKHRLAIAGKETWFGPKVREAARRSGVADRIQFLGFVADDDLLHLYNACDLFVFPSFYEGFGLPILEAMACGRPVACSNTSAMPEVADGAALLFDPYSSGEIARAMSDLLRDPELRTRMERLGQQRAAHFSWNKTARRTLDVYYEVASQNRGRNPARAAVPSR